MSPLLREGQECGIEGKSVSLNLLLDCIKGKMLLESCLFVRRLNAFAARDKVMEILNKNFLLS